MMHSQILRELIKRCLPFILWSSLSLHVIAENINDKNSPKALFDSVDGITVGRSVLAGVAVVLGAVFTFAGYRLFRPTMFACAFLVGGVFVSGVVQAILEGKSSVTTATWIAFFVGGVIVGSLVLCLYNAGVFMIGAAAGILLAGTLNNSFGYRISSNHPTVVFIILAVVLGILGGLLMRRAERTILIIVTAFIGSQTLVWGIGYFAGKYPNPVDLKHMATKLDGGERTYHIPRAWWGYVAAMVILFILGAAVQFRKTSKGGVYHRTSARAAAAPKSNDEPMTPKEGQSYHAAETPHGHYGNPVTHV